MYKISELFYSIQGEGHHTGMPAVFIRFSGCNLHCSYCDTKYHTEGSNLLLQCICNEISKYDTKHVVLTGGEPFLQIDSELLVELEKKHYLIHVETNGTINFRDKFPDGLIHWITVSPKKHAEPIITSADELKVVTSVPYNDVDWLFHLQNTIKCRYYFIQPESEKNIDTVIKFVKDYPTFRLSIQVHKLLNIL